MAWQGSDRRERLPSNWQTLRIRVLRRDGYRCQGRMSTGEQCPYPARDVDHVIPGDDHRLSNLQALCPWHHGRKSAREGAEARLARRAPRLRPSEPHPGLL